MQTDNGTQNPPRRLRHGMLLMVLTGLLTAMPVLAQDAAGKIIYLKGTAWVEQGQARKNLDKGSIVYVGDQVRTGKKTSLQMRFLDQTLFTLGPQAKMTIDSYDERDAAETGFAASILRGAFRFVSGLLARKRPEGFKVQLTVGTIGVRGTHVAGEVFERQESDDGVVESSARVMLLEDEEDEDKASSIVVSNDFGSVVIDEPGFGTEIPDEHSPPSPVRRMQLRSINNLLRAVRNATRRRLP